MAKPIFPGAAELPWGKGGDGLVHLEALRGESPKLPTRSLSAKTGEPSPQGKPLVMALAPPPLLEGGGQGKKPGSFN